jgi:hypothetical protein
MEDGICRKDFKQYATFAKIYKSNGYPYAPPGPVSVRNSAAPNWNKAAGTARTGSTVPPAG